MSPKNSPSPPEIPGEIPEITVTGRRPSRRPPNPFPYGVSKTLSSQDLSRLREQSQTSPGEEGSGSSGPSRPLTPAEIAVLSGLRVKTGSRGADLSNLRHEIIRNFPQILAAGRAVDLELPPMITSGREGTHGQNSLHYQGLAIDLRVNDIPIEQATQFRDALRRELGPDYDVSIEKEGTLEVHIHLEYDPD